jgi:superfamily II DNA/RNA helicase
MKKKERDQLILDYNANKIKALLLSSAGGEGLDLKGTRQIQVLDPHFNEDKIRQIIGRGVRYKSHTHLPEDQRNVLIERYLSKNRPTFWNKLTGGNKDTTAEEYLDQLSKEKLRLNDQVIELLKQRNSTT